MFGGVGIAIGLVAGLGVGILTGVIDVTTELLGILAGCAIVFVAGLADDLRRLSPIVKLAAQFAAAGTVVLAGLSVEIVSNDLLAAAIAIVWLVGITNAFNLLDNMDGLAATLAAIACGYFALDAATIHDDSLVLVLSLALGGACLGFLPFNLRPGRRAALFMGDGGSQLLGFALAAIGLASSWTATGVGVATILLPLLILAVPILDTTLVTVVRIVERRPVTQGGRDHSSHRLVYHGLSEGRAVALLAAIGIALGATAVAYNILVNARVTVLGVLVTVVLLVEFATFLSELEERSRSTDVEPSQSLVRSVLRPRRLVEVVLDFVLICTAFLAAYAIVVDGLGDDVERAGFLAALPVVLAIQYVVFVLLGVYRRIWRFATVRDALVIAVGCGVAGLCSLAVMAALGSATRVPATVYLLYALIATAFVGGSRVAIRLALETRDALRAPTRRRILVVGAGRFGRSLARELRETPGDRVVGYLDDNPAVRHKRLSGVAVLGTLANAERAIHEASPDVVMITIPNADSERLRPVIDAAAAAGIPCRLLQRQSHEASPTITQARAR